MSSTIRVKILLFAGLAEAANVRELDLLLPAHATVSEALDQVQRSHPAVAAARPGLATAVNLAYVPPGHALADGDELALIPPVSGG